MSSRKAMGINRKKMLTQHYLNIYLVAKHEENLKYDAQDYQSLAQRLNDFTDKIGQRTLLKNFSIR